MSDNQADNPDGQAVNRELVKRILTSYFTTTRSVVNQWADGKVTYDEMQWWLDQLDESFAEEIVETVIGLVPTGSEASDGSSNKPQGPTTTSGGDKK